MEYQSDDDLQTPSADEDYVIPSNTQAQQLNEPWSETALSTAAANIQNALQDILTRRPAAVFFNHRQDFAVRATPTSSEPPGNFSSHSLFLNAFHNDGI